MSETPVLPEGQESFRLNEVCKLAKVQPYMLRFWTTEFSGLEAGKSGTGQRFYTREQVELILEIRRLLFDEGMTIAGAKKKLAAAAQAPSQPRKKTAASSKEGDKQQKKRSRKKAPAGEIRTTEKPEAAETASEVDKEAAERVQRLLLALREVRDEVAALAAELREK